MNICAAEAHQRADDELNRVYAIARGYAATLGNAVVIQLRDAQRAWIAFRDEACELEGMPVAGGSMQPLIVSVCLERLTRRRTEDLRLFGEAK